MAANQIKFLRAKLGLSQRKFGEQVNVSQSLINALENGSRLPTERFISDICRVYNVNVEWLTDNKEPIFLDPLQGMDIDSEVRELTSLLMALDDDERSTIIKMIKTFKSDAPPNDKM